MNLPEFATRRRVTVGMTTLTLVLFGLIGLAGLKVNLLPDLSYPTLTVRTDYEGAAPLEIENLISRPVEEAVGVARGVRKVHSISRTGQSDVVLEFAWGTDMDMASLEVRDKLDTLQLPLDAKKPLLLRFNPSTDPILRLGLSAGGEAAASEARLKQLRRYAEEILKKRLEPVTGVAAVKVGGGLEDEIEVAIDQQKLARLGLDINEVVTRLRNENVNASGGRIDEGSQRFLVRTINQFDSLDVMRDLVIRIDADGVPVRLKDIATVGQGYKEREGIVRIDGREAVELALYKEGDANTVSVAAAVRAELDKLRPGLPVDTRLSTIEDQSVFIENALHEVKVDALIGGLLAILVIFFFLGDAWSTFIISLSLPVSLIATFFFMDQLHLSLNVMSLGGLALATGMVVDDSIVVLENIARLREKGVGIHAAAVRGTAEVGMAVTASTLTTVAVFFPLVFVQGVAGQLFRDQALTITFAMLVSLAVAMTLIPMLASLKGQAPRAWQEAPARAPRPLPRNRVARFLVRGGRALAEGLFQVCPRAIGWLLVLGARTFGKALGRGLRFGGRGVTAPYERAAAFYHRSLPRLLAHPWRVLGFAAAAFAGALALVPTLGLDLIPQLAQGRFDMTVTLPPGTPLAETDRLAESIARRHAVDPGIASIYGVAGTGTRLDASPTDSGENIARLSIALAEGAGKSTEATVIARLREGLDRPDADVKFARPALFSFSAPLEIEVRGYDLDALAAGGQRLAALMKASRRFADVKSTVESGYPEVRVHFDQDRAAALGLTTRDVADRLVRKVKGEVATRYDFRDRKIDVLVRARAADRGSVDDLRNLIVGYVAGAGAAVDGSARPGTGGASAGRLRDSAESASDIPVRLSAVADVIAGEGPGEIHRISQERVAIVSANLAHGDLASAIAEVEGIVARHPLAAGVKVHVGGQSEELHDSVNSLLFALGLAIFLVYLVMASQFESLLHPFVIMFSIPLAAVGAILALKLSGSPISVVVFIGLIMLVGIVVKNAIVLIDRVNQLREAGTPKHAAIMQAAESRLRPIVMTTLCTLIGFAPLAIGIGDGAEVRAPMALTVIGGLAVSTLLTLVVVPVVYDLLDRRGDAWYAARGHAAEGGTRAVAESHGRESPVPAGGASQ